MLAWHKDDGLAEDNSDEEGTAETKSESIGSDDEADEEVDDEDEEDASRRLNVRTGAPSTPRHVPLLASTYDCLGHPWI